MMYLDIVVQKMKRLFKIPLTNKCRLWKKHWTNRYTLVTHSNQTLYDDLTFNQEKVMSILMLLLIIHFSDVHVRNTKS